MLKAAYLQSEDWSFAAFLHKNSKRLNIKEETLSVGVVSMEHFSKKFSVADLKEGMVVDDIFFVKFKKGMAEYAKGFSFELTLSDASGKNIEYKYWGGKSEREVKALYGSIKADSIVKVQGKVSTYKDRLQLATNEPMTITVLKPSQYDSSEFVKGPRKNIDKMYERLLSLALSVKNQGLRAVLKSTFEDKEISEKFRLHPGAIEIHHNWISGLLEHTLEVAELCLKCQELYPDLDRDLLIAGSLLHDIGKLEEIEVTSRIRGTTKGQLYSHLILSTIFVEKKCEEVGLDEKTKEKLLHIIISHHGKLEYGAPKEPMFPEAVAVHYADELSSKLAEMTEFINSSKTDTEDDFMFHKRSQKNIFLR